jgi:hypothetical protein
MSRNNEMALAIFAPMVIYAIIILVMHLHG